MTALGDIFEPGSPHGRTYAVLVHHPRSSLGEVAEYLGVSKETAAASLEVLTDLQAAVGQLSADGEAIWDAHAPESLSESEARRRQHEINQMHAAAARLSETFRSVRRSPRTNGA